MFVGHLLPMHPLVLPEIVASARKCRHAGDDIC